MQTTKSLIRAATFSLSLILPGCGQNNISDLQAYVADMQNKKPAAIEPLPQIFSHATHIYDETGLRNPFKPTSSAVPIENNSACANTARARDALEEFPLDSLTMVGSLQQQGERWALIRGQDGTIYRRKTNDYMGQNNGRILKIDESSIELLELITQNHTGCIKKTTLLTLNE